MSAGLLGAVSEKTCVGARIDTEDFNGESGMRYSGPPRRRERKFFAEPGAMLAPELNRQQGAALTIKRATYREDTKRRFAFEKYSRNVTMLGRRRLCAWARPR